MNLNIDIDVLKKNISNDSYMKNDLKYIQDYKNTTDLFKDYLKVSKLISDISHDYLRKIFCKVIKLILVKYFQNKFTLNDPVTLMKTSLCLMDFKLFRYNYQNELKIKDNTDEIKDRGEYGLDESNYKDDIVLTFSKIFTNQVTTIRTKQTTDPDRIYKYNEKFLFEFSANVKFNHTNTTKSVLSHIRTIENRNYQKKYGVSKENTWLLNFIGYKVLPDSVEQMKSVTVFPSIQECSILNWMYVIHDHDWTRLYIVYRKLGKDQIIERIF